LGIEVPKDDMSMWKTSFLILESPYKGWNVAQNLMLLNNVHQSGKLELKYDCSDYRVGKYTIASHERLIVRPLRVHCKSEKKDWRAQLSGNSETFCGDMSLIFVAIS
jgi:hypothetical protein